MIEEPLPEDQRILRNIEASKMQEWMRRVEVLPVEHQAELKQLFMEKVSASSAEEIAVPHLYKQYVKVIPVDAIKTIVESRPVVIPKYFPE